MNKVKNRWEVVYVGRGISLNDFYAQGHFSKRVRIKERYSGLFRPLMEEAGVKYMNKYMIACYYNSRHDPSNVCGMVKVFEDTLLGNPNRKKGIWKYEPLARDDNKLFCKGIMIFPDESLGFNTFKFIVQELE